MYKPVLAGSRSSPNSGRGGGKILLNMDDELILDGLVTVDGDASDLGGNKILICYFTSEIID